MKGIKSLFNKPHKDDLAVDRFSKIMKDKLSFKRTQGRGGWEDKKQVTNRELSEMLMQHVLKGDPIDVANIAMMINQRGETINQDLRNNILVKKSGSYWKGKFVGFYSTWNNPMGYAIELMLEDGHETGTVQIYPKEAIRFFGSDK